MWGIIFLWLADSYLIAIFKNAGRRNNLSGSTDGSQ
jgi:hypothetical protein